MLIKKISGNWHRIKVWEKLVIGYKSGGLVITGIEVPGKKEQYFPFYEFADFRIEGNILLIKDKQGNVYRLDLAAASNNTIEKPSVLERCTGCSFEHQDKEEGKVTVPGNLLIEEPLAFARNNRIIAVVYRQKGIDFFDNDTLDRVFHYDFPGYSFIDDVCISGAKLYIADVFGLRILDIADIKNPVLDDRATLFKGWPKDVASYGNYILVADVLGIKIYDKNQNFAFIAKIESNRNRVAKVTISDHYAFLSCEAVGLKIADISHIEKPRLVSGIVLPKGVWDCAVYKNSAYLAAYTGGLLKIDITDIKNLKQTGCLHGSDEIIGVSVNEKGVFAACSYYGFKVLDHHLEPISCVDNIDGRCWRVLEADGFLYVAAGKSGLYIYDARNLQRPVLLNRVQASDARDLKIKGNLLYLADGQNGVSVYNSANKNEIKLIKRIPSAAFTRGIMVDDSYLYKADGDGGLEIYERRK